jgi:hypothetical protein
MVRILFFAILLVLFSCKTKNILYVDYVLVEKTDGSKDTLTHKYWNKFTWDEYKMEWFIKHHNLDVKQVSNVKLLYTTKQTFTNKELNK